MSMLWLSYEHGWTPHNFGWDVFKRVFQRENMTAEECMRIGRETFTRKQVQEWMEKAGGYEAGASPRALPAKKHVSWDALK